LRDYLKRSWNLKPVVDVHQLRTEYAPGFRLHIVSHDSRALRAVWPEPDEGNLRQPFRLERQYEQLLKDTVRRPVYGPGGKRDFLPAAQVDALQVLAKPHRHKRPQRIIRVADHIFPRLPLPRTVGSHITFPAQAVGDITGVKRQ